MTQRLGSIANVNIHLRCIVLDGVYRRGKGGPVLVEARPPTAEDVQAVPCRIGGHVLNKFARRGTSVEGVGCVCTADDGGNSGDGRMRAGATRR